MEHDSSLYIGGGFITVNGTPANGLVRYDGSNFYTYPVISSGSTAIVAVCFYNGEMYVGGNFDPGGGLNDIEI
ncbi:MAG: hypothetical protein IPP71_23845 [Bacteroidetes bacterium]|nr:hypothetical protein [Bacteroidota bacterium]